MRLISIKLSGFKSFVELTFFGVPGQLVGVVGPNGCGKSNIIDAVRWVLGESKASELRGESMQDVIFNGSTYRKPAGRASVELVFDNSMGKAAGQWGQYAEIAVKRTLTREGVSTYYINNQVVRRRDVQDIFMGTGLGPRAYAIIGQGMISRIIEARPEELRVFLEEAAGVSRYKERRRETENRLHSTHENLTRVEDILRELTHQLEKLTVQAGVASQFHQLQSEQEEKQKLLWLVKKNEAIEEQTKCLREIDATHTALESQTAQLRHIEVSLEHCRQAHYSAGDAMHEVQSQLYQTNTEIGGLEAHIRFAHESRQRAENQLATLKSQSEDCKRQKVMQQEELNLAEEQTALLIAAREEAKERVEIDNQRLPEIEQQWRARQEALGELRTHIMQIQQQFELIATKQRHADNVLRTLVTKRERLQQEKSGREPSHAVELEEKKACEIQKKYDLEHVEKEHALLVARQIELDAARQHAQENAQQEKMRHAQLEARLAALVQLQTRIQSEARIEPWLVKQGLDQLPRLWQKLHVKEGFEIALESVLREAIQSLEVSVLQGVGGFVSDVPPAKLTFFSTEALPETCVEQKGLTSLLSMLKINDAGLRAVLQGWLSHVYIANDVTWALAHRSTLPLGGVFVTREGHKITAHSVHFYAQDSEQDGFLARAQEIEQLQKQVRAQQLLAEEAQAQAIRSEALYQQGRTNIESLQQTLQHTAQSWHMLQMEVVKLSELASRLIERDAHIESELLEISIQEEEQQAITLVCEEELATLDQVLATHQEKLAVLEVEHIQVEQALTDARAASRDALLFAQQATFTEQAHVQHIEAIKRAIAVTDTQIYSLNQTIEQAQLELASMEDETVHDQLELLLQKRTEKERLLSDARHELDQLTQRLRHTEEEKQRLEKGLEPQRDQLVALQLKEQAARLNQEQYSQALTETGVDEEGLRALTEKLSPALKPAYLQTDVTRLAQAIAALGPVNLAALDELSSARERKAFLDAQHADLTEAITTLQQAIHKIDMETRELLQETFNQVNTHFSELFPTLFGGGHAKLVMTGEEILDAGVQVMAQPPGKKNATIHLLSGGEKALTATALVFALFQLNPAPFCLLDEVDAPLDDANTERFCKMVKKMSSNTQFLFISHNKVAMEMAEQLIGVTMQEQGVSRIVAVDIQEAAHLVNEEQLA